MSTKATKKMLTAYLETGAVVMFLTSLFRAPRENFYDSKSIEIDIEREGEDVSIGLTNMSEGARLNGANLYTNKEFVAPAHREAAAIDSFELINRQPGDNPFQSPVFRANLVKKFMKTMSKVSKKIARAVELQASQVLQTGTVTLIDANGATLFTVDYKPKSSHFPTTGNSWSGGSATIVDDLIALADVIRNDSLMDPDQIIMGVGAFENAMKDADFASRMDNRRINLGAINPMATGGTGGANFRGTIDLGNYKFDLLTYGARYKHQQTGVSTQFVEPDKVIMRSTAGRLDATFGSIPNIGRILGNNAPLLSEIPSRISSSTASIDLSTNTWITEDGASLMGEAGTRPLLIPTAIDSIACLDTEI